MDLNFVCECTEGIMNYVCECTEGIMNYVCECTEGIMNYDHLNIYKRIISPIHISKINVHNVITEMVNIAEKLHHEMDNNMLCEQLSEAIYDVCKRNYKTNDKKNNVLPNHENCNSTHYKAAAKMNLLMYKSCCNQNVPQNESVQYLQNWIDYENIAIDLENNEINS